MTQAELNRAAIKAMLFAILGWTLLPVIGWLFAISYAHEARVQIVPPPEGVVAFRCATAARSIAFVGLALLAVATVLGVAAFILVTFTYRGD